MFSRRLISAPRFSSLLGFGLMLGIAFLVGGCSAGGPEEAAEHAGAGNNLRQDLRVPGDVAPRRDVRFNHLLHVKEEELACEDCHGGARESDRAGLPEMELCADCHSEETDEDGEERSGCLKCHTFDELPPACTEEACTEEDLPEIETTIGPLPIKNLRYPSGDDSGGFSHKTHFEQEVACSGCHGDVGAEEKIPFPSGKYMPRSGQCYTCHAKDLSGFTHKKHTAREIDCSDCHGEVANDDEKLFPSGRYLPDIREDCRDCHEPVSNKCSTCHVRDAYDPDDAPDSHTTRLDPTRFDRVGNGETEMLVSAWPKTDGRGGAIGTIAIAVFRAPGRLRPGRHLPGWRKAPRSSLPIAGVRHRQGAS